jgi:threonylcarbamoyladenosine tRNA methylthiotransferase MtaB
MKVDVVNFGCRLNSYESEVIKELFRGKNIVLNDDEDLVIFNSCAVTKQAEGQLCQAIRKVKRERKNVVVGVVGCAVQVNSKKYLSMTEVDFIIGNNDKLEISSYLNFDKNKAIISDVFAKNTASDKLITGFENRSRAFIQIQNGCDNRCTFCLTRLARGYSVSIPSVRIIEQVKKLVDSGYREIVLTGIDVSDYGKGLDENINLGLLIKEILKKTSIERLRISSLDISKLNADLKEVFLQERRLMPHIHLSLQSGDNIILCRMLRRHRREDVIEKCLELKNGRKGLVFGADLIAGFPTETEEAHQNSLKIIKEIPIVFGHIFPYSERPETKAALMPQVDKGARKRRAGELRSECAKNLDILKKNMSGTRQKALIEEEFVGRLENYLRVKLKKGQKENVGKIIEVEA